MEDATRPAFFRLVVLPEEVYRYLIRPNIMHIKPIIVIGYNKPHKTFNSSYTYELVKDIARWLMERTKLRPKIGIICGTGLGSFPDEISHKLEILYSEIPNFPKSTVAGHPGKLVFGKLDGHEVVCFTGKIHFFEGYDNFQCTMAVRVMKLLGITHLLLSNAAGSVDKEIRPGDVMLTMDHINLVGLAGLGPLKGPSPQVDKWGDRFLSSTHVYDRQLIVLAQEVAEEVGLAQYLKSGVYMMIGGPNFETVAESRMMKLLGANALGMSTVSEATVAMQAGMKVFAFSVITNMCCLDYENQVEIDHFENIAIGEQRAPLIAQWIRKLVQKIALQN